MIKTSRTVRAFLYFACAAIAASVVTPSTYAAVTAIGDVLPIDLQHTEAIEGLPPAGNEWNDDAPNNAQDNWEDNVDIIVGQRLPQGGRLDIDSNSILRYQTMIIGDQGLVNGIMRKG